MTLEERAGQHSEGTNSRNGPWQSKRFSKRYLRASPTVLCRRCLRTSRNECLSEPGNLVQWHGQKATETQNEMVVVLQLNQGYYKLQSVAIWAPRCFLEWWFLKLSPPSSRRVFSDIPDLSLVSPTPQADGWLASWCEQHLECGFTRHCGASAPRPHLAGRTTSMTSLLRVPL